MAAAIGLRVDFDARSLRAIAKDSKDGPQSRRLLALASIYDGGARSEAAKIGGVTLQVVRDWVLRFNADGRDGLVDRKAPGQPSRLDEAHRTALAALIEEGPTPAIHGVALADRRSVSVDIRGVPRRCLGTDHEPRAAQNGLSQAVGAAASSCAGRRRDRGY